MEAKKNQEHINKVLEIARKTRSTPPDELEHMLTDYSVDSDITKTIQNFLLQASGLKIDLENIKQPSELTEAGLSDSQLFFILDKQNDLKMVVKVFENSFASTGSFIRELSGLQVASTIDSKDVNLIYAKAIGKSVINKKAYGLLALSPGRGTNIQDLVIKMLRLKPLSPERSEALHLLQSAFERLGKTLAKLHQIRPEKNVTIHHTLIENARQNLEGVITLLSKENYGIDIEVLEKYFECLIKKLKNLKTTRCLAYGDPNLCNFIYHEKDDTISIVDLENFRFAADQEGNPISNAAIDFMGTIHSISLNQAFGMNEKEKTTLIQTFINAYGSNPTTLEQEFFELNRQLDMLSFFLKLKETNPEKFADVITNKILKFEINAIKKTLNKIK